MAAAQNCPVQKRRRSPRLADHNGALCLLAAPFNGSYRPSSCYGRPRQCASVRYLFKREIDSPGPPDTCFSNARIVRTVRVDSLRSRMITRRTMFPVWSPGCECRTELVQPEIACAEFCTFPRAPLGNPETVVSDCTQMTGNTRLQFVSLRLPCLQLLLQRCRNWNLSFFVCLRCPISIGLSAHPNRRSSKVHVRPTPVIDVYHVIPTLDRLAQQFVAPNSR